MSYISYKTQWQIPLILPLKGLRGLSVAFGIVWLPVQDSKLVETNSGYKYKERNMHVSLQVPVHGSGVGVEYEWFNSQTHEHCEYAAMDTEDRTTYTSRYD